MGFKCKFQAIVFYIEYAIQIHPDPRYATLAYIVSFLLRKLTVQSIYRHFSLGVSVCMVNRGQPDRDAFGHRRLVSDVIFAERAVVNNDREGA